MKLHEIRERYGPGGIADFDVAFGRAGAITDDTQMTLFTAEGLLRALTRWEAKGICHPPTVVWYAYQRWLHTQGPKLAGPKPLDDLDGWLIGIRALHANRAPGRTCVSALQNGVMGTVEKRINNSKGCGTIMRAAPVGLIAIDPFRMGCDIGALTHGHPSGWLASGALALIVHSIIEGSSLTDAIETARARLQREEDGAECVHAIEQAVALAAAGDPSGEKVHTLGGGWTADDALSIAVYAALAADGDFARGVRIAVNHDGDSDSTGAIAGNILGALLGVRAIPDGWLAALELRDEITAIADDLLVQHREGQEWWDRYPGW